MVRRLKQDGWVETNGGKHDVFTRAGGTAVIVVPRHRTLSPGVARQIAKTAGWLEGA